MTVVGISMMKDEVDVAYTVVRHMADEVDAIIVADNGSTDGTREALDRAGQDADCDVLIVDDPEVGYYQSRKMTALAQRAYDEFGATWIVPFDADEIWFSRDDRLSVVLKDKAPHVGIAKADLYNHFCTWLDDCAAPNPFERMVWRQREAGALPKVAFRWQPGAIIAQGNHSVSGVDGYQIVGLEIRHFPYRSWEHFLHKAENGAKAYRATNLPEHEGAHWRGYWEIRERHGEDALREVYETYFSFLSPMDEDLVLDPAPVLRWRR